MKPVVHNGPRQASVTEVPDARVERRRDALVRITSASICGSDLHMYEGQTDSEPGRWFGQGNPGEVVEVGDGVDKVEVGEHVVLPSSARLATSCPPTSSRPATHHADPSARTRWH
jgi:glutathione-independent formaldehyde dehydrogenase